MKTCLILSVLAVAVHFAASKTCSPICPAIYAPVCGTDGVTYSNKCMLEAARDCNNKDVELAYTGTCNSLIEAKESLDIKCVPRMSSGACTREYMPICGSDGKTYGNRCTFCYAMYKLKDQDQELTALHYGQCKSVEASHDECPESSHSGICTDEYAPVCASDGNTYSTKCTMCAAMFQKQKEGENIHIHVVHNGPCKETAAAITECLPREKKGVCTYEYMPVCDSEGVTHPNKCSFCYAMAQAETEGKTITLMHKGQCVQKRSDDDIPGCPKSSKDGICTLEWAPICASNGVTYGNKCEMCYYMYSCRKEDRDNCFVTEVKQGEC